MEREELKSFIDTLLLNDGLKLRRAFGVGLFLFNKLRDYAPHYLLESLKDLDRMSFEKKVAILREVRKFLQEYADRKEDPPPPDQRKPLRVFRTSIDSVKILSSRLKTTLKNLGINTVLDALFYFPVRYEDRRLNNTVKTAKVGEKVALKVRVKEVRKLEGERYTLEVLCEDPTGTLSLKFRYRNPSFAFKAFRRGMHIVVYGKLKSFRGEKYMVHPEIKAPDSEEVGRVIPVYYARKKGEMEEISSKARQKRVRKALQTLTDSLYRHFPEYLPRHLLDKYSFPDIALTIRELHIPQKADPKELNTFKDPYHRRVIYDELLLFQLALLLKKLEVKREKAPAVKAGTDFLEEVYSKLPFRLTEAQKRAVEEILRDLSESKPMNRLLQGDVGSGKTVVAMISALAVVREGYQVAVMVPTEILAHQHYRKFSEFLSQFGVRVGLLTGSLTPSQKASVYRHTAAGNIQVLIGTHALIQEKVEFRKLGYVIIDEQHRFGVLQRKLLLEKGKGLHPHCLVMSATPIPRTMALSLYGDLDLTVIDELPPGRKPVKTLLYFESEREKVYEKVKQELEKGNKVYVIYPLIEESDKLNLKAATEEYDRWRKVFPDRNILLLHGKMPDREKLKVMEEFKERGDILVSTTVIEVGIDVPEATVMVIEDAHRFGLSQLHQLRGRVGRSDKEAWCIVVVPDELKKDKGETLRRLRVFVKTHDGFKIAEEDLKLRGPGELIGVSQSGYFGFQVANLARSLDRELLFRAREDAEELLRKDPLLEQFPDLRELLIYRYGNKLDLSIIA
ncbi:MAG: ATP-dependent DNA helicase RecG [Aquificae bacterium]|nr:ATP-dependent DNA helicase RecG [Aquificota bacterium]